VSGLLQFKVHGHWLLQEHKVHQKHRKSIEKLICRHLKLLQHSWNSLQLETLQHAIMVKGASLYHSTTLYKQSPQYEVDSIDLQSKKVMLPQKLEPAESIDQTPFLFLKEFQGNVQLSNYLPRDNVLC